MGRSDLADGREEPLCISRPEHLHARGGGAGGVEDGGAAAERWHAALAGPLGRVGSALEVAVDDVYVVLEGARGQDVVRRGRLDVAFAERGRDEQQLGALQRECARRLGELDVVAD